MQKNNNKVAMFSNMAIFFLFALLFLLIPSPIMGRNSHTLITSKEIRSDLQTYIVHVRNPEATAFASSEDRESWYRSFLPVGIESSQEERMIYSYNHAISGFAARLTEKEVELMKEKEGFVSALPDRLLPIQTTHTPTFLKLNQETGFWKDSNFGKGVIVGLLDTGIFPDHPSFSGVGMPSPPSKWKGRCDFNKTSCNNKLIGARSFISGMPSETPIDELGHGTHTASTAAGRFVENANVFGNANGTAVGMAPLAHLAMYKVCYVDSCKESDILAGLDAAIDDGVDVLSLSLGGSSLPFYSDNIAIGAFGAMKKNIFVSCAGGNSGPFYNSLSNEAPWILTVGASTMDRKIVTTVKLGNGEEFDGESLYQPHNFTSTLLPLVYPGDNGQPYTAACVEGSLDGIDVRGKVVLCEGGLSQGVDKGAVVKNAGGAAMIVLNGELDGFTTIAEAHVLPASNVGYLDGLKIKAFLNSSDAPTATIVFKGTVLGTKPSPMVASFSSRGPSMASPGILKPDIIGPGVNVLAAWPFQVDPSNPLFFNVISGTSMSTPHLGGIAALLKSSHPNWSPAAIKSAMMTTADLLNNDKKPIVDETLKPADLFTVGAGHVNPSRASNPGLVYDLRPCDYIPYLCGLGYTDSQVESITHSMVSCSNSTSISEGELNYPSFSVTLGPRQTFSRTVTNVGDANSTYAVAISPKLPGVNVNVKPSVLKFTSVNQMLTFSVTFSSSSPGGRSVDSVGYTHGHLWWVSTNPLGYHVMSPISVTFG